MNTYLQARIKQPPIPLINKETDGMKECDIIKIKMIQNLSNTDLETYKLKIVTFEHGQPEEFLSLMKNFKKAVDGTGNTQTAGNMNYICTILHGEEPQKFD